VNDDEMEALCRENLADLRRWVDASGADEAVRDEAFEVLAAPARSTLAEIEARRAGALAGASQ
jgi:hypothetical protein